MFHDEFALFLVVCIQERNLSQNSFEYDIIMVGKEGERKVLFNHVHFIISCSCKKIDTFEILYCHALKVFETN